MDLTGFESLLKAGLPIWILTGGGLLCLLVEALSLKKGAEYVCALGLATLVTALAYAFDQWSAGARYAENFFLLDPISLFFVILLLFIGVISLLTLYSYLVLAGKTEGQSALPGGAITLLLFSILGGIFMFASDHLILNFIGLEILSVAVYILVGMNRDDPRSNEAAMKYFVTGSVASAILLYGVALLYGAYGTFQLTALASAAANADMGMMPVIGTVMVLVGLFFKLSLVPFHFWAPDVYEGAPTPITGFMATGVKVSAFALFIRVLISLKPIPVPMLIDILSVCVILTVVVGNLAAIVQDNVKRVLAYSSIAHAGYALLGLVAGYKDGAFDPKVVSAVLFYLISYSVMTLGAFAVLSTLLKDGKETTQFADLAGLGYRRPGLALAFTLFLVSLLGIPPTVGFFAKYGIFSYAVQQGYITLAIIGVLTSLVSAYYYLKPIVLMYFKNADEAPAAAPMLPLPLLFSVVFCAAAVVYLGIQPTKYLVMAQIAVTSFLK